MNNNTNPIKVDYSDAKLYSLVDKYITMQKHEFTFGGLCSYVLYWAKEEGKTDTKGLYESNEFASSDCERLTRIIEKIVREGRATVIPIDNTRFVKTKE